MIENTNMRNGYKYYRKYSNNPVKVDVYMKIVSGYLQFLLRKILEGFQVQLSGGNSLGTLAVVGKKVKIHIDEEGNVRGGAIDWITTSKLRAENPDYKDVVYYTNDHTNGIKYNLAWWKTDMKIGNKNLYSFVFPKPARQQLAQMIRDGKEYLVHT